MIQNLMRYERVKMFIFYDFVFVQNLYPFLLHSKSNPLRTRKNVRFLRFRFRSKPVTRFYFTQTLTHYELVKMCPFYDHIFIQNF